MKSLPTKITKRQQINDKSTRKKKIIQNRLCLLSQTAPY